MFPLEIMVTEESRQAVISTAWYNTANCSVGLQHWKGQIMSTWLLTFTGQSCTVHNLSYFKYVSTTIHKSYMSSEYI